MQRARRPSRSRARVRFDSGACNGRGAGGPPSSDRWNRPRLGSPAWHRGTRASAARGRRRATARDSWSQRSIAQTLSVSDGTLARVLERLRSEWAASAAYFFLRLRVAIVAALASSGSVLLLSPPVTHQLFRRGTAAFYEGGSVKPSSSEAGGD